MNPAGKALWFVESHFADELTLDDIAEIAGVSRCHLTRAFGEATGHSVMRYVRGRRLTEAARALANGAADILAVALDAGYNSHEAFTRAFGEQFGVTPEALRAQGDLNNIELLEPIKMEEKMIETLEKPRIVDSDVLLIAGPSERYNSKTSAGIPAQWQHFVPWLDTRIPGRVGGVAYGVRYNGDDDGNFDYICGVEVSGFSGLPADWSHQRIAPQKYLVFTHRGHISTIRSTWNTAWNKGLPESGYKAADAPSLERYAEDFDGATGLGGVELWIPASGSGRS
jgi:AraC family transcriptional regulator